MKEKKSPRNLNSQNKEFQDYLYSYESNLISQQLPVVYSLKHLSLLIELDYKLLKDILKKRQTYYRNFYLRKKNGGNRQIQAPNEVLKYIQNSISKNILSKMQLNEHCFGFREGFSIKDNANVHTDKEMILRVDLYRFFDSITERRIYGIFKQLGYLPNLAYDFAKLTTVYLRDDYIEQILKEDLVPNFPLDKKEARLPQGAPTSPMLSNLIAKNMDNRFGKLSAICGFSYSRYADDLTFSGARNKIPHLNIIKRIIEEEGFYINPKKINYSPYGTKQLVTGLTVSNGVHVPKKFKQETKRHLYFCNKFGVENHLNKINFDKSAFKEWILGRIYFIYSIEPQVGENLLFEFNKVNWYSTYPDFKTNNSFSDSQI